MATYHGTHGDDVLVGNFDDDIFYGHGGNDRFEGRNGNDVYYVDNNGDVVIETYFHGYDTIYTIGSYVLSGAAHVEVLSTHQHIGTAAVNLTGNWLDNFLIGNAGANILNGGGGAGDVLAGLGGNDIYYVNVASVEIIEEEPDGTYARGGRDTVYASISYVLAPDLSIEILSTNSYAATAAINLTGNNLNNEIYGNAGANILDGGGGSDTLVGFGGDDTYLVNSPTTTRILEAVGGGTDTVRASVNYTLTSGQEIELLATDNDAGTAPLMLTGNNLNNEIRGNAGANILNGGTGQDVLVGLEGNDTYYVNSADDEIVETTTSSTSGDRDIVYSSVDFSLQPFIGGHSIEVLSAISHASTDPINLTGSLSEEEIFGNAGTNILSGLGGHDRLFGLGGDDTLLGGEGLDRIDGGAGNDSLDGGLGNDRMTGGTGNDLYFVDNSNDSVFELAGEGFDTVRTSISHFLTPGAAVELLATIDDNGTASINLVGNALAQEIRGNQQGNTLTAGDGDDVLNGLGGVDTLYGQTGADWLDGGAGNDRLIGGAGADTYAMTAPLLANVDQILEMIHGTDRIALDDAIFTGLTPGALPASAFVIGDAAADSDDRIIVDTETILGSQTVRIYFDPDGNGPMAQTQFASAPGLASGYSASDFVVI